MPRAVGMDAAIIETASYYLAVPIFRFTGARPSPRGGSDREIGIAFQGGAWWCGPRRAGADRRDTSAYLSRAFTNRRPLSDAASSYACFVDRFGSFTFLC